MTLGRGTSGVAGGPAHHIPVLVAPALSFLDVRDGGVYIDGTFGAGGYTRAILAAANCRVMGLDRDTTAIALGADLVESAAARLTLVEERFSVLDEVARGLGFSHVDGVVLDVGVSSMQLDEAERGFSFRLDGPLDMRMGREGPSAADVIAAASERDLAAIIGTLGEERYARAVARAIVAARQQAPIATTSALARVVSGVVRAKPGEIHPATRTFQGLRMFVNEELGELAAALAAAESILATNGRLVVVAFHSLEDRLVKNFLVSRSRLPAVSRHQPQALGAAPTFRVLTKRPVVSDAAEIAENPRSRSAKLRAAERTDAASAGAPLSSLLPHLPNLTDVLSGR